MIENVLNRNAGYTQHNEHAPFNINSLVSLNANLVSIILHLDGFEHLYAATCRLPRQVEVCHGRHYEAAGQEENETGDANLGVQDGEQQHDEEVGHPDGGGADRDGEGSRALLEHFWRQENNIFVSSYALHRQLSVLHATFLQYHFDDYII